MVRAQLAVRDLKKAHSELHSLLIVGAGVAGIAAALEASKQGVKHVVVVEAQTEPFILLKNASARYVGPYMYEWPSSFSRNQSYPKHGNTPWGNISMDQLQWSARNPIASKLLAKRLKENLLSKMKGIAASGSIAPTICTKVDPWRVKNFVREFAKREAARAISRLQGRVPPQALSFGYWNELVWPLGTQAKATLIPQYVLLAVGMGKENTLLVVDDANGKPYTGENHTGPDFWGNDNLLNIKTVNQRISVFGGGDGALQDVLRTLTRCNHPLQFIAYLEEGVRSRNALSRVMPTLLGKC